MIASRREVGFTLLELLIAITILGLLATILFGGLRFGTRVWNTGDQALERFSEVQSAYEVMRRTLTRAVPLPSVIDAADVDAGKSAFSKAEHKGSAFLAPRRPRRCPDRSTSLHFKPKVTMSVSNWFCPYVRCMHLAKRRNRGTLPTSSCWTTFAGSALPTSVKRRKVIHRHGCPNGKMVRVCHC